MNYAEAIQFLYDQLPMYQRVGTDAFKKDLSNTLALCKFLGNPERDFKSIHIAGTNGKGTSAHMVAAILQSQGYKTGLYTSPHLKSFTERIKVNGQEIQEDEVIEFVDRISEAIKQIGPSFFEITVAMAFYYFNKSKVDFAVVEVGLGGRLDSTNVIRPEVCLITNIGYDHQNMLGNTLTEIAAEKAGIIKEGIPVVIGKDQPSIESVFVKKAAENQARIVFAEDSYPIRSDRELEFCGYTLTAEDISNDLPDYQIRNIPGVLGVIHELCDKGYSVERESVIKGLTHFKEITGLKGRWQKLGNAPLIYADVGHNEDGINAILQEIAKQSFDRLVIVWGMVKDKDPNKIMAMLPTDAYYIFCRPQIPRAMELSILRDTASKYQLHHELIDDVNGALAKAKQIASSTDLIFVGGSTFVVAEIDDL